MKNIPIHRFREKISKWSDERLIRKSRHIYNIDAEELYDKRQAALLELLKDASCCVSQLTDPTVKPSEEFLNGLKERLRNMIKDMEGGI